MSLWKWPWLTHGNQAPPRRRPITKRFQAPRARLAVELLEDRLSLSTVPTSPAPLSYADWRKQKFTIETQSTVGNIGGQVGVLDAGMGEGFGGDIGLDKVASHFPYRGNGYSVAIIDTGIDYNNPALGGGWGKRVIAGYNFVSNTSDPMDDNGHGTHVAGIIGSSDATYTGIAPGVNFIALKVLDSTGSGTFGAVDQALQWVATHQAQYHIVAVNMSMGAGNFTTNPYSFLESDFSNLIGEGVFIACASGNSFYSVGSQQGLAYPAISPQVVSVGAVWDGNFGPVSWVSGARDNTTAVDQIASFTQRSSALDILAPGAMITSTYLHNTFKEMAGTSMATPVAAGAAVLIHQALDVQGQPANEYAILSLMRTTGVTIVDNNNAADNVVNTGLSFKRLDLFAALSKIGPTTYAPPTLAAIPNQTMAAGAPLVVALSATAMPGATLTYKVQATSATGSADYQVGQQLGLHYAGGYFQNSIGQNEKWVMGSGGQWYCLMPSGALRRWMGDPANTLAAGALVASLGSAAYADPTRLWTATSGANPNVTLAVAGSQLTIQCDPSFLGSFTVTVIASDGITNVTQAFTVLVTHRAVTLGVIANQTLAHASGTLTVTLPITNPDNVPLAITAQAPAPSALAYSLWQTLNLTYTGNYWTNYWGVQEKWLLGGPASARQWYCILPTGELRRAGSSLSDMRASGALVATLDASFYQDPSLLWNAQSPIAPPVTIAVMGNQLTISPAASFVGTFTVQVAVQDGQLTTARTFSVMVTDSAPMLGAIANQTVSHGKSLAVNLSPSDPDGEALSLSAQTVTPSQQARSLDQTLGLIFTGNYWTNYYGRGEKWLQGVAAGTASRTWYCLLPNGELRLAGGSAADMMAAASLAGTLDPSTYLDPSLLWNAAAYAVPQVSYALAGNSLTVTPAANFTGSFVVQVAASDGALSARQSFLVTVTNAAPVISSITTSNANGGLSVVLAATDADGDAVSFTAQALSTSQAAYNLRQTLGLTYTGDYWTNYFGAGEQWLLGHDGQWYFLLPNGELRLGRSTLADSMKPDALIATLDSAFYADPSLLWNAQMPISVPVSAWVSGNQVTVMPSGGYHGTVYVQISATDGFAVSTQFLKLAI